MPSSCPRCQAKVDATDAFCPNCGTSLMAASGGTVTMPIAQAQPANAGAPAAGMAQPRYQPAPAPRIKPWYAKKRFIIPITMLIIVGMIGAGGAWWINSQFGHFSEISTPPPDSEAGKALQEPTAETVPTQDGSITILLMGVDAREGEEIDIGVRPDSLSVLHINPEANTCRTVSIPRDTRTDLPGYGQSKINHALSVGGVEYQQLVTQNLLGVKIDHFALVDFAGVVGTVDALGGVDVNNEVAFEIDGVSFPAGPQHLNGEQALLYSRFRGDSEGDFGRQRRQMEVVRGMLQKADGLDAARAIPSMLNSIDGHFKTDLSVTSLIGLAGKYRDYCSSANLETAGLEGTVGNDYDEMMQQELSFVHVSQEEIDAKVRWLLGE